MLYLLLEKTRLKTLIFLLFVSQHQYKKKNKPNLNYLKSALETVYEVCKTKSTVIIESTVYPGVSENLFSAIFKKKNKVELCYSPERINPGDNQHTIENIIKVVSFKKSINR